MSCFVHDVISFQEARRIEREKQMEMIKIHERERRARQQEEARQRKEEAEKKKREREASRRAMINPLAFKGTGMSVRNGILSASGFCST